MKLANLLRPSKTHGNGARTEFACSADEYLDRGMSSSSGPVRGTYAEQPLAAERTARGLIHAMEGKAAKLIPRLPTDGMMDAEVDYGAGDGNHLRVARLKVSLPYTERTVAQPFPSAAQRARANSNVT